MTVNNLVKPTLLRSVAEFKRVRRAWRITSSVKVRWPGLQSRRQGEGQGRRREAGSGGSPIRSCGAMNNNRIPLRFFETMGLSSLAPR